LKQSPKTLPKASFKAFTGRRAVAAPAVLGHNVVACSHGFHPLQGFHLLHAAPLSRQSTLGLTAVKLLTSLRQHPSASYHVKKSA
jgi:hypothetical protein